MLEFKILSRLSFGNNINTKEIRGRYCLRPSNWGSVGRGWGGVGGLHQSCMFVLLCYCALPTLVDLVPLKWFSKESLSWSHLVAFLNAATFSLKVGFTCCIRPADQELPCNHNSGKEKIAQWLVCVYICKVLCDIFWNFKFLVCSILAFSDLALWCELCWVEISKSWSEL